MTWVHELVQTPDGPGEVVDIDPVRDITWVRGKPSKREYEVVVRLDSGGEKRYLSTQVVRIPQEVANE